MFEKMTPLSESGKAAVKAETAALEMCIRDRSHSFPPIGERSSGSATHSGMFPSIQWRPSAAVSGCCQIPMCS